MSNSQENSVTIIEDYYKDDKGVWYRWRTPNEQKWHIKLTGLTDLPYVRFKILSQHEFNDLVKQDSSQEQPLESAQSNKADTNDINEIIQRNFGDTKYNAQAISELEQKIAQETNKAVIKELESLIEGQYVSDFTKHIQARANELKLTADKEQA